LRIINLHNLLMLMVSSVFLLACSEGNSLPENIVKVQPVTQEEKTVRSFVRAFSENSPDNMASYCTHDVQWGYVSQQGYASAGRGRDNLITEMNNYFASTKGVRSEVENLIANGPIVAMTERVFWLDNDVEKTQSSLAVYQFEGPLIKSVWYYPEQP